MRTSLREIKQLEEHIFHQHTPESKLVLEARLLLDRELRQKLVLQKQVYRLIEKYGRKRIREEIEAVHHELFHTSRHRSFKTKIARLFSNPSK